MQIDGQTDDRAPTLRDVARLAGVHPATASRALSGSRTVTPDLVRQVRKAAESLNYRVNPVGRALKQRSTGVIGMVVPDLTNPFFPDLIRSIERALSAEERALFLCDSDNQVQLEASRIEVLINRQVDGLIVSAVHARDSRVALEAAMRRLPLVQVDRRVSDLAADAVVGDQHQMMSQLITHLRGRGSRSFCLIASGEEISPAADRINAYRALMIEEPESRDRVYRGDLSVNWGMAACERLLGDGPQGRAPSSLPDAIVCVNDLIAAGVVTVLRRHGLSVPTDVRVVGFDNTPLAAGIGLTTVQQPIDQIGQDALEMLGRRTGAREAAVRRLALAGVLVARESG